MRILLIEDHPDLAANVGDYLSGLGHIYAKPDGSGFETLTGAVAKGWTQRIEILRKSYADGIAALDSAAQARFGGGFAALNAGQQDTLLTALRQRGLAAAHLPALALGLRQTQWRWRPDQAPANRLAGLLATMTQTARHGQADLDRLTLARAMMLAKCAKKSKSSRLRDLMGLFIAAPLVTVQMAAKTLKIWPQGSEALLASLCMARPPERTGRKRYRAWGIL